MPPQSRIRRLVVAAATLAATCSATPAIAAPGTFSNGGGSVTISDTTPHPGDTLTLTATGFDDATGLGSVGSPIAAVKPNGVDDPFGPWVAGGADLYTPDTTPGPQSPGAVQAGEAKIWFKADAAGTFTGTVKIPANTPTIGPGSAPQAGQHWLQVLSGAPFTSTAYGNQTPALTAAITIQAFFRVVDRVEIGVQTDAFYPGTTVRNTPAPTQLAARGRGFTPDTELTAALGGAPVALATAPATVGTVKTTATGALPDGLRLNLGTNLTPGDQALVISTGTGPTAVSETHTIKVLPAPTGTIDTPRLRPGGLLSYRFGGFVGIGGAGQKVAIALNSEIVPLACIQADATGSGSGVVRLPATLTAGLVAGANTVRFLSGTSCVGPAGPLNDYPGAMVPATLTVSDTAPTASAPAEAVVAGSSFVVSGAGFGAGEQVAVDLDGGATIGTLTANADGAFSGAVALPAATTPGAHVLRFASPTETAVARLTTSPAPVVVTPPAETTPITPTQPTTTTTPSDPPKPSPARPTTVSSKSLKATKQGRVSLTLRRPSVAGKASVSIDSRSKVRLKGAKKAKVLTLVKSATFSLKAGSAKQTSVLSLKLTADAKALLKRVKSVKVVVRVAPKGGKAFTKTMILRR